MKKIKLFALAVMAMMTMGATAETVVISNADASFLPTPEEGVVTPKVVKKNSADGYKFGSTNDYIQWVLEESIIKSASFSGWINSNNTTYKFGVQFTVDNGANWGTTIQIASDGTKKEATYAVAAENIPDGANGIRISRISGTSTYVCSITLEYGSTAAYPFVKSFTMGETKAVVDTATKTITAELPYGTDRAAAIAGATVVMGGTAKTFSIAGDVLTAIDSVDTGKNIEYSLTGIKVSEQRSDDATLKALYVNGVAVTLVEGTYTYAINVPYTTEALVPAYEVNDNTASAKHDVTGNVVTVTVTAQAENTQDYVVNVTIDPAVNKLKQAKFTNGYYAYQKDSEETIHAYYLEGTTAPTIDEASIVYDGASMVVNGNTVTVTGADAQTKDYVITLEAVTPGTFTTDEIALDSAAFKAGTFPAWVIAPYGIANKSGKEGAAFSKTDSDYSREWAGKTHIEMFMPACDTVLLYEPGNSARDIKVFVNGTELSAPTNLAKSVWTTIVVEQSEPFMLTIQSKQTGGDGLINKIRMAKKAQEPQPTALSNAAIKAKAQKFMVNGAVYFRHNAKVFNMMGQEIRF